MKGCARARMSSKCLLGGSSVGGGLVKWVFVKREMRSSVEGSVEGPPQVCSGFPGQGVVHFEERWVDNSSRRVGWEEQ